MKHVLSFTGKPRSIIGHESLALSLANDGTQVGFTTRAELACAAFGDVEGYDVVAYCERCDAFSDGFDDTYMGFDFR
jgi:hypothetical protein